MCDLKAAENVSGTQTLNGTQKILTRVQLTG